MKLSLYLFISLLLVIGCQTKNSVKTKPTPSSLVKVEMQSDISAKKPTSDSRIRAKFRKQLGLLKEANKTTSVKELQKQLNSRKHCKLQTAKVRTKSISKVNLFAECYPSTLIVGNVYKCGKCSKWHESMASGFAVTSDVFATNHHVMENKRAQAMGVMTPEGDVYPVIEILAASDVDDVALVRVKIPKGKPGLTPTPIALHTPIGSSISVISHPTGRFYTFTEGMVSRYTSSQNGSVSMTITADYAKGSSGGPVFDPMGNVCGMVSTTSSIYYGKDKNGSQSNLQMVIKSCVPAALILKLIKN